MTALLILAVLILAVAAVLVATCGIAGNLLGRFLAFWADERS